MDLGVAQTTAKAWLSILEASYITFRLPPYHTSFGKRLVKTPKLYFHDVGLAAWLLGIQDVDSLNVHPMRGALFENFIVLQYLKFCKNTGRNDGLYFWRDNVGNEVDFLIERAGVLSAIEIKSGATFNTRWINGLDMWCKHAAAARRTDCMLISDAPSNAWYKDVFLANWKSACVTLVE
jgi:predicted AAA+ superfamily ATPase